jgi:two-component system alkaline phosphatase synthesis response regulator PhoP
MIALSLDPMPSTSEDRRGKVQILCVEDDISLQKNLTFILWKEGYDVICANRGEEALEVARSKKPDLILLDLMLPGIDGHKVCRILKKDRATAGIFIIMVTAKKNVADIVDGLEKYADDYITKPFEPEILLARVRALLRRTVKTETARDDVLTFDDLVIDREAFEVRVQGAKVALTKTEFDILDLLAGKPSQVFSRSRSLDRIREDGYPVTERVVDYHISGLRKNLGPAKKFIETIRGVGYKFNSDV